MGIKENLNFLRQDLLQITKLFWLSGKQTTYLNLVLQLALAALPAAALYCIKVLVELLFSRGSGLDQVLEVVIAFGVIQLLIALATQYSNYVNTLHQQKVTDYLSSKVLHKAIEVDYEYYENPAYHDSLHLAQQQSIYKAAQLLSSFNAALLNSLSLILLVGFFFTLDSTFGLLFTALSVPLACIKWYSGFALARLEHRLTPMEREANYLHHIITSVNYAKEVRALGFGESIINKFKKIRLYIHNEKKRLHLKFTIYSLLAEMLEIAAMVLIFGMLAKDVWANHISAGLFVVYIQGFQRLQSTSRNFLHALVQVFQQRIFLKGLFSFLRMNPKNAKGKEGFPGIEKGLKIQDVGFTYPGGTKAVLNGVSMECRPGEIIAIVGENGSGKSTLVKLINRLYSLQAGSITVDDKPLDDINISSFREESIVLFQDFEKYFFSIEDNITLGSSPHEKSPGRMATAAGLSGAEGFIKHLPDGYQTRLGRLFDGSEQLSGGQWQKLALSRIFYKNASLVILDEPTSALDPQAEFDLFNNIKSHSADKMVILVSHRLYNLKLADRIYVMEKGQITECGSFDELIDKGGIFKKLYELQKL